ncbi:MAG: 5-oxoprolinase subunit PxpB [Gemmataceae bacterium]|nr:5-oxoprolinase subunit PxpB [Gemmataceae bacterium]
MPLGDQAVLVYWAREEQAQRWAERLQADAPPWLEDVVVAYVTVGVFYQADKVSYEQVCAYLQGLPLPEVSRPAGLSGRLWSIPVCYEEPFATDLQQVAIHTGLAPAELIRLHYSVIYTVYAIGFVPGFPYLGYLPAGLSGVPRLPSPRREVPPGSVGIAGRQTGIYPLARPGGWHLIGRTPLTIVDVEQAFFPLKVGDRVRFYPISTNEFHLLAGRHLDDTFWHPCPHDQQ